MQSSLRGDWRGLLEGLRDDFTNWTVKLFQDWAKSRIFRALTGSTAGPGGSGGGGGGLLSSIFGGVKGLFGGGAAASSGASAGAGPWVNPATFAAEFGGVPSLAGAGAGASPSAFSGLLAGALPAAAVAAAAISISTWTAAAQGKVSGWKAVLGGGLLGVALGHFARRTEKDLRKAIQQARGVDIKDMGVLGQIKAIGEQAFGQGQVRKHLGEVIQLNPVQEIIDNYAVSTGQQPERPTLPHEFLYNAVGGPSSSPISVSGNTLMPSPFSGGQPLAEVTGRGLVGGAIAGALAPVVAELRGVARLYETGMRYQASVTGDLSRTLSAWKVVDPEAFLRKAVSTPGGQQTIGDTAIRHAETTPAAARRLQRSVGVDRM